MKRFFPFFAALTFWACQLSVQAQFGSTAGLPNGLGHVLEDILGAGPAFYGQAVIQESADGAPAKTCDVAMLGGVVRVEMTSFQGGTNLSTYEAQNLNKMRSILLLCPDRNRTFMIFPDFKSFLENSFSKGSTEKEKLPVASITKGPPAKDTIGDQVCQKSQWHLTESDGEQFDVTVWNSTNWNNFPIQMKMASPSVVIQFQTLHLEAPDAALFDLPGGYVKYEGIESLIKKQVDKAPMTNSP